MFHEIPTIRPPTPLLDQIRLPGDLRRLPQDDLGRLSHELRHFLLYTVGQTGGHFGAGLGVVELTVALHYIFDTPRDKIIWDVGHQTYPHKILTGRGDRMALLRQPDGLAPFPNREESEYDVFGVGHSSTSISAALGIALAASTGVTAPQAQGHHIVVVIGDGAMTAGMAFEALNHLAAARANVLILLNDNAMSISENVGGLANYFAGSTSARGFLSTSSAPGSVFRDLGYDYSGPIDGHNIDLLLEQLRFLKGKTGPRLLHLVTTKGKGFAPAEHAPVSSHSLARLEKTPPRRAKSGQSASGLSKSRTYANCFGDWICTRAAADKRLIAITPAMKEGSDLVQFASTFPTRFHDVAIAEQHAVTLAAGLAAAGARPVVAIYSTFLQRAYDQVIHDVAIQNLDVLFAVDRASLLEDGPTHSGVFDLSFLRAIPNLVIMAPSGEAELIKLLDAGYDHPGPALVRYPRGNTPESGKVNTAGRVDTADLKGESDPVVVGQALTVRQGRRVAILSFGALRETAGKLADRHDYTLMDMRFIKPLDAARITVLARTHELLVTLEENVIMGGAGSGVNELIVQLGSSVALLNLGIPDQFIPQDKPQQMLKACGLDEAGIERAILARLALLETRPD